MAKNKNVPAVQDELVDDMALLVSPEEKADIVAALNNTEFDAELGSEILNLEPGQSVRAAVIGMTKVAKFNDFGGEKTEEAIALLVVDEAAAGGAVFKAAPNEVLISNLKEFALKAQSGGGVTPVYIECLGKITGKNGQSYKNFNVKTTVAARKALQA